MMMMTMTMVGIRITYVAFVQASRAYIKGEGRKALHRPQVEIANCLFDFAADVALT